MQHSMSPGRTKVWKRNRKSQVTNNKVNLTKDKREEII